MADRRTFAGTVVRVEREGFGVVEFDQPLGANTHGIFSTSISEPAGVPYRELRKGMHVRGVAETDDKDLAAIKTLTIEPVR
jgi:hypothetical protein